jgi:thiamine kinase-like enzyme
LLEEKIEDTGNQAQKLDHFLEAYSRAFYEATSRLRPIGSETTNRLMSWSNHALKSKLTQLRGEGKTHWPVALSHGDLSGRNMLVDRNGRFALCDFERAAFRPVALDLAKLYIKYRKHRVGILETLDRLAGDDRSAIDAASQMAMCIALRAIRFEDILANKRGYRAGKFSDESAKFRDAILKIVSNSNLAIEGLVGHARVAEM